MIEVLVGVFRPTATGYEGSYTRKIGGVTVGATVEHDATSPGSIGRVVAYGRGGGDAIVLDPRMTVAGLLDGGETEESRGGRTSPGPQPADSCLDDL